MGLDCHLSQQHGNGCSGGGMGSQVAEASLLYRAGIFRLLLEHPLWWTLPSKLRAVDGEIGGLFE